ncbi:MAG: metalloregulator ArsR/SmtB family transcription factor [Clostridiales bacterium]|nr:metalloregulator ArsR/SmtB family transcription factor [Clostridiales bacterium]
MNTLLLDSITAAKVENSLPPKSGLTALASFFDALSDVTRLKILSALTVSKMCVSDLAAVTGLNQTTVSHQLRILKDAHIVDGTRQGKVIFYGVESREIPTVMNTAVRAVMNGEF